ncbi:MAG: PAS domain S-box protein [Verrucomicrobiales bacterium]|nr:PAS domain S-box protein [Verrucomicrobiales bacterium]
MKLTANCLLASDNPFFEPLNGDDGSKSPDSNVFAASPVDQLVKERNDDNDSPFTLDEAEPEKTRTPEEPMWESVFASLPQAVVVLDELQNVLYTNPAHKQLLGIDAADEGMELWFRHVCQDPDKLSRIISSWHEHIWRNQLTRTFLLTCSKKGDRYIEFRSSLSPEGYMIILQTDVTDDMASDEALRQANLKFRNIFSNSTGGIIVVNQEGLIHDLNDAFSEFSGKSARDLLGKPFLEILNPEDAEALRQSEENDLQSTSDVPRKVRFSFSGQERERPALVTSSYITNQNHEAALKIYQLKPRDTQLLAKLHELSSKAQSLLDAVPNMFVLLDREGTIKDWSPPSSQWEISLDFTKESIGQKAKTLWPAFGKMLDINLNSVFDSGLSLRQEITYGAEKTAFPVTLSPFGKDLALALIEGPTVQTVESSPTWQQDFFVHSNDAVLVTTTEGDVIEANPASSRLLGQTNTTLTRSNIFQLLSKAPGSTEGFDLEHLDNLNTGKTWHDLLSISSHGPQPVSATLLPVKDNNDRVSQFVSIIKPKQLETLSESDVLELSQSQFRSQLQTITSLFSIATGKEDTKSFITWLIRLKVLAESMTSSKRVGIVHLLRDIADQVSSVAGKGLGPREVVVSGSSSLTIENEIATPFALLVGEVMSLAILGESGNGPSVYIDVESYEGNILLTAKPGESRELFTPGKMDNARVIEVLVEQIRGKISVGVGDDNLHTASMRLTFPCQQT